MPPTLTTPDGKAVDVTPAADAINRQFDATMNDDGPDTQAPPRRQPQPPAEDAPKPRRGRPRAEDKARAAEKPPADIKDDYTKDARQLVGGAWAVTASIPFTQPYALVIHNSADALVPALAEGAKHNATIRAWVSSGDSSWMLTLAGTVVGMGMQAFQLMKDPELREQAAKKTREQLKEALAEKGVVVQGDVVPADAEEAA